MLIHAVAKSESAANGDSEDFGEAAEADVVAFGVFGRWGFVVWGGAATGGLGEGAPARGCCFAFCGL